MTDTKLTVKFLIPGSKPYTEAQCKKPYIEKDGEKIELPNAGFDVHSIKVVSINKNPKRKGGKELKQTEYINYTTRRTIPAVQVINMSNEAYQAMLEEPPVGYREHGWNRLYENAKLKAHLDILKQDLHAYSYEFFVAPD